MTTPLLYLCIGLILFTCLKKLLTAFPLQSWITLQMEKYADRLIARLKSPDSRFWGPISLFIDIISLIIIIMAVILLCPFTRR